jgi:hypothetical protein
VQSALTGNEDSVRPHDDGLQQPKLAHAGGQRCNVAHLAAMARADLDFVDWKCGHCRSFKVSPNGPSAGRLLGIIAAAPVRY